MIVFPFVYQKKLVLPVAEYGVTSNEWLLQHITHYMEDSEMSLVFRDSNNLIYRKINPWKSFKRDHLLKNIEYNADSTLNEIKLTITTQHTVTVLAYFFLIIWALFLLTFQNEAAVVIILSFAAIFYSTKYIVFQMHCTDILNSFDSFRKP